MATESVTMEPQEVSDAMLAFPANVRDLLPDYGSLPRDFVLGSGNKWTKLADEWFFTGLSGRFIPKDGIDLDKAMRHLSACMGSYQPKHEHKIAGVAYLMSQWFSDFDKRP